MSLILQQPVRTYATSNSSSSGGLGPVGYGAIAAVAGLGGYYYYANVKGKAPPIPNAPVPSQLVGDKAEKSESQQPPPSEDAKTFLGGDQDFVKLKLDSVEDVNHNTKRFIFSLAKEDHVSGVHVACKLKSGEIL